MRKAGDPIQRFSESTHIGALNKACKMMKIKKKLNSFSSSDQRQAARHTAQHRASSYLSRYLYLFIFQTRALHQHGGWPGRAPLSSHRKLLKVRKLCSQIILHDLQFALYLDRVTITQHGLIANLEQYRAVSSSVYHFIKQLHFPICSTIT